MLNIKLMFLLAALLLAGAAWVVRFSAAQRSEQTRIHEIKQSLRVQPDTARAIRQIKDR